MIMKKLPITLVMATLLASCTLPFTDKEETVEAPAAEKVESKPVKLAAEDIDFETAAKVKAAELQGDKAAAEKATKEAEAKAAKAKAEADKAARAEAAARAKKEAEAKAAAEKIAKEEEAARKLAEQRAQKEAAAAAKRDAERLAMEEKARLEAEQKAEQEAARLAAEKEAETLAAEKAKAEADAKALAIAQAEASARAEAEAKAAAEQQAARAKAAAEEAARKEAEARAAAEAKAAEEAKAKAAAEAAARARASSSAAAAKPKAGGGFYIPDFSAAKLDSPDFTPMGAERKGNADGSIPEWTGKMRGVPAGLKYSRSGDVFPDPYGKEKPLFTIHAGNFKEYSDRLSEGLKVMFQKYPDSFYMHIYPSHRDGRFNELVEQRTAWNLQNTRLVNGVDGLNNYTGGAPFPFPKNANEVLWNGRIIHPNPTLNGTMDDMVVYLNGNTQQRRQVFTGEFPFSYPDNPVGKVDADISENAALVHVTIEKPDRQKGQMTIIHEALDQVKGERKVWVYLPGSRRVRRAPTVGYDTPDGPGGLVTVDDSLGFNGAMDRYNWTLLGKKEMYIPYHSYKFDSPGVKYDSLLQAGHANPEYMRYELHRVWVVEANLKADARHVYAKRRFYIDEDSWHIVLLESYDGRGDLWRVGILNTLYDYAVKGYIARAQMFHDLQSGAYIAMRLVNETSQLNMMDQTKGAEYYSPANLRTMGR